MREEGDSGGVVGDRAGGKRAIIQHSGVEARDRM